MNISKKLQKLIPLSTVVIFLLLNACKDDSVQPGNTLLATSNGKIFFTNRLPSTNIANIFSINPDGSNQTQISFFENLNRNYIHILSLDYCEQNDKLLIYLSTDTIHELFSMNSDGTELTQITNTNTNNLHITEAIFSQSGQEIFFKATFDSLSNTSIYKINSDGTNQTQIINKTSSSSFYAIQHKSLEFSPKNNRIYSICYNIVSNTPGISLFSMNLDGTNAINLTNDSLNIRSFDLSKDKENIVYPAFRRGTNLEKGYGIYVSKADGSDTKLLLQGIMKNKSFVWTKWSNDGKQIAFLSDQDSEEPQIYVMNSDGTSVTRITDDLNYTFSRFCWK